MIGSSVRGSLIRIYALRKKILGSRLAELQMRCISLESEAAESRRELALLRKGQSQARENGQSIEERQRQEVYALALRHRAEDALMRRAAIEADRLEVTKRFQKASTELKSLEKLHERSLRADDLEAQRMENEIMDEWNTSRSNNAVSGVQ